MTSPITLGDLENALMHHLWEVGEADVKSVWRVVGRQRKVTHNTIQTTMDRLFKKGLLNREKVSHAFVYQPALTPAEFRAQTIRAVAESVSNADTEMLAAFVDVAADVGGDTLKRLQDLIAAKRKEESS